MGLVDTMLSLMQAATTLAVLLLSAAGGLLYWNQTAIIYPANMPAGSRENVDTPDKYGMPTFQDLAIRSADGQVLLRAYLILQKEGAARKQAPTVLYCHANAGNMGHRLPIARVFYEKFGCNVLMFSYRGYGKSEGSPHEAGLKNDAQSMLDYLLASKEIDTKKIVVFGQSIGGAVAIDLVSKNEDKVLALIIENTFTSLPKLIPIVMPVAKYFTLLCTERWPSEERIIHIERIPVMMLAGLQDELIPHSMMKELFELLKTPKKSFATVPDGTHNDTCVKPSFWEQLDMFWKKHIQSKSNL